MVSWHTRPHTHRVVTMKPQVTESQLDLLRLWLSFFCRSFINALVSDSKNQLKKEVIHTIWHLQNIQCESFQMADMIENNYRYHWFPFWFVADLQGRSCWQWGPVLPFQGCDKHPAGFLGATGTKIYFIQLIYAKNIANEKKIRIKKKITFEISHLKTKSSP